ncbi:hypothetical protein Cus16_2991 [Curtobacterium sp. ER1/6]|nr:hypothetical protein Cus16_2991 [Curtobacterium sp. ER1/6]
MLLGEPVSAAEQLLAEGPRHVLLRVRPAGTELGDDELDDVLPRAGGHGVRQVEPVDVGLLLDVDQPLGDGRSRPDGHRPEPADRGVLGDVPDRPVRPVLPRRRGQVRGRRLDRVRLDVAERLVEVVLRQVDAHPPRVEHERALGRRVRQVVAVLRLRGLVGLVGDDGQQRVDLRRVPVAAGGLEGVADLPHRGRELRDRRRTDEDGLGVLRSETDPAGRCARLVDDGAPLHGRLRQVDAGHVEVRAVVLDRVDLRGVGEDARLAVLDDGVVLPRPLPQLVEHLEVLVGHVVAVVVAQLVGVAHVPGGTRQVPGDDVPADAALRQVVERRHAPRERIGVLVRGPRSDAEAEVLGHRCHRRDEQDRVVHRHLRPGAQGSLVRAAVHVVRPEDVGDEDAVEVPAFEQLRQVRPVRQVVVVPRAVAGVPPQSGGLVRDAVHVERVEADLPGLVRRVRHGGDATCVRRVRHAS